MRWPKPELPLALVGETVDYMMPLDSFAAGTPAAVDEISEDDYAYMVWRIDVPIASMLAMATELSEMYCKALPQEKGLDFDMFSIDDTNTTVLPMWVKNAMRGINGVFFAVNKELSISAEYNSDPYGITSASVPATVTGGNIYLIGTNYYYATADITGVMLPDTELVRLPDNFIPTGKIIFYVKTPTNQGGVIQTIRQSLLEYFTYSLLKDFYIFKPAAKEILPVIVASMEDARSSVGNIKSTPFIKTTRLKSRWP